MKINRRTQITIVTEKFSIAANQIGQSVKLRQCTKCDNTVHMVTADEAAKLAVVSSRVIYRLVESGKLHSFETPDGSLLVCPASLANM